LYNIICLLELLDIKNLLSDDLSNELLLFEDNEFNVLFFVDIFNEKEPILLLPEPSRAKVLLFSNKEFKFFFIFSTILLDE